MKLLRNLQETAPRITAGSIYCDALLTISSEDCAYLDADRLQFLFGNQFQLQMEYYRLPLDAYAAKIDEVFHHPLLPLAFYCYFPR